MKTAKAVLIGLLVILIVVFVVQNLQAFSHTISLRLNLLFTTIETPALATALLLLLCFALGFLASQAITWPQHRRMKKSVKSMRAQQARMEEELKSLRNLPITGELTNGREDQPATVPGSLPLNDRPFGEGG